MASGTEKVSYEADIESRRAMWRRFTLMTTVGTIVVAALLILMAIFLL